VTGGVEGAVDCSGGGRGGRVPDSRGRCARNSFHEKKNFLEIEEKNSVSRITVFLNVLMIRF
jgi:hypothetical protein